MSWGPAFLDVLLAIDVLLAMFAIMVFVRMALERPAFYIWFTIVNENSTSFLYFIVATTVNLMLGRLGKDGNVYETLAACIVTSGFLWWFINFINRKAVTNFFEDCKNFLPGSCPLCTLHRAGAYYKFVKHGAPVPDHPECSEKSG